MFEGDLFEIKAEDGLRFSADLLLAKTADNFLSDFSVGAKVFLNLLGVYLLD